ncbi:MAG TPA: DUF4412 domain-containing protein [Cyclobacteriaceae bacterium]|nr:DUF4412 domain-containing protein [Cyclobacteriaceae bacterium]
MKTIYALITLLISLQASAQSFEGTIQWSAKSNPADARGMSGLTIKAKGNSLITVVNGGMMHGAEMWYLNRDTKVMRVMRPQKMFAVVPQEALAAAAKAFSASPFVKSNETSKVLSYTVTKFTGEVKMGMATSKVTFWTTTDIKDDQHVLARQPDPFGFPKLPEGVTGIPLKIEIFTNGTTTVLEVVEVKSEKLADGIFTVPSDFKEMGK